MPSMGTLDIEISAIITTGLRSAMSHTLITESTDPLMEAKARLDEYLYDPLYAGIQTVYNAGYSEGSRRIKQHMSIDSAYAILCESVEPEDPLITQATHKAISGIQYILENNKDEIRDIIIIQLGRGATVPQIQSSIVRYFDDNPTSAQRFARTLVTDIYTRASLNRYKDSGVVDGVQFSAHMDDVTSIICRMYNGTIWRIGDPGIMRPPLHFNCRSDLLPYFGEIPPSRDFVSQFGAETVTGANDLIDTFKSEYWSLSLDSTTRPASAMVDAAYSRISRS